MAKRKRASGAAKATRKEGPANKKAKTSKADPADPYVVEGMALQMSELIYKYANY